MRPGKKGAFFEKEGLREKALVAGEQEKCEVTGCFRRRR